MHALKEFANYYRKCIPNFAEKAEPIINFTRKETPFHWNQSSKEAFDILMQVE